MAVQRSQQNAGCLMVQEKMHGKILFLGAELAEFLTGLDIPDSRVNKSNVRWKGMHDDVFKVQIFDNCLKSSPP